MNPGYTYLLFIDPLLRKVHRKTASLINPGDRVIDIACGNGSLSLCMAERAKHVTGIDHDKAKIEFAKQRSIKRTFSNTSFLTRDAADLSEFETGAFDVAVTSMAIHQFPVGLALSILKEMKRIAVRIIVLDYNCPLPAGFGGSVARIIERMAGKEHHANFKSYMSAGGMDVMFSRAGCSGSITKALPPKSVFTVTCWQQ